MLLKGKIVMKGCITITEYFWLSVGRNHTIYSAVVFVSDFSPFFSTPCQLMPPIVTSFKLELTCGDQFFSKVLKERIERVKAKKNDAFKSKSEFTEEMLEIRKDFVIIHGEMILLQTYSSLNFAGEHMSQVSQSALF